MPFDTLAAASVTDELHAALAGGRIQRIIQPSAASVSLAVYKVEQEWVVLSADAQGARVQSAGDRLAKAFPTPSPFVMLLRKHLDGAIVDDVTQTSGERIMTLTCRHGAEVFSLIAEVMGKHSNVLLVRDGRILGALKIVTPRQSRVRPIIPGHLYTPPPVQERDPTLYPAGPRRNPMQDADLDDLLEALPDHTTVRAALFGLLTGSSPFLVDQIARRAGVSSDSTLAEVGIGRLIDAARSLYAPLHTRVWQPCTFTNERGRLDFAPYLPLGMSDTVEMPSISAAIEKSLGGSESRDIHSSLRIGLLKEIDGQRKRVDRRIASLQDGLVAGEGADAILEQGHLTLAYQHTVSPRATELLVPDIGVVIPLDPSLSAVENAERLFRRYRKLKDARKRLPAMLIEAAQEKDRLDDVRVFAMLATTEGDFRNLRNELRHSEIDEVSTSKRGKRDKPRGPARFTFDGVTALVGRNSRENEEVTFRLARRDDLWLHVRERTGAHLVLQSGGREITDVVLLAAAALAAYFSEGRTDTYVDVDITEARNVRKIPGGAPGRVTYGHFRTIRVEPGLGAWSERSKS